MSCTTPLTTDFGVGIFPEKQEDTHDTEEALEGGFFRAFFLSDRPLSRIAVDKLDGLTYNYKKYIRHREKEDAMPTKLTLRLDETLIRRAKSHAKRRGKSVSQLVADYFTLLDDGKRAVEREIPPVTRSLRGGLRGAAVDESDYRRYLEEKHR